MQPTRLFTMLLASLALSSAVLAADVATVFSLKGQARVRKGEGYNLIAVGNGFSDGSFIQVGAKSKLGIKPADGSTIFFGENSSFRIRYVADSGPGHLEVTLLAGTVAGNFSTGAAGSSVVRTAAGVVDTNNASLQINYVPGPNGTVGKLDVRCVSGSVTLTVNGATIVVPAGSSYNSVTGKVSVMTKPELAAVTAAVQNGVTVAIIETPTGPSAVTSNLSIISPNGEGQGQ